MASNYKVGDKIVLFKKHQEAIVRYVGKTKFAPNKISYGLELCGDVFGDTSGTVNGRKYFKCPKNKGLFVFEKDIKFKIKVIKRTSVKKLSNDKNTKNTKNTESKSTKTSNPDQKNHKRSQTMKPNPTETKKPKKISKTATHKRAVSMKKLGPRDVGRNDNYKGIQDKRNNKTNKTNKTNKAKNKTANKNKKKRKKKKTPSKSAENKRSNGKVLSRSETGKMDKETSDSDSYKSGYSGASGHSGFDESDIVDRNVEDRDRNQQDSENMSDREDSEYDESTLTGKVMMMMKQREEEREMNEMKEEKDKTVLVAMTHRQMKEDMFKNKKDEDENIEEHIDNATDTDKNEEESDDIDDDLPEINKKGKKKKEFKSYAQRRGSEYQDDRATTLPENKKEMNTTETKTVGEEKALNGKTENVIDNAPHTNAQKGCCVVL